MQIISKSQQTGKFEQLLVWSCYCYWKYNDPYAGVLDTWLTTRTAKGQDRSGWTMFSARVTRISWKTVHMTAGGITRADTPTTSPSSVPLVSIIQSVS